MFDFSSTTVLDRGNLVSFRICHCAWLHPAFTVLCTTHPRFHLMAIFTRILGNKKIYLHFPSFIFLLRSVNDSYDTTYIWHGIQRHAYILVAVSAAWRQGFTVNQFSKFYPTFSTTQILAYLVHNMSRSQLYLGFGHIGWLSSFFRSVTFWRVYG